MAQVLYNNNILTLLVLQLALLMNCKIMCVSLVNPNKWAGDSNVNMPYIFNSDLSRRDLAHSAEFTGFTPYLLSNLYFLQLK